MGTTQSIDLLTEDYTDFGYWKELTPVNLINDSVAYAALSALGTVGEADSYFLLVDHNDLRSVGRGAPLERARHDERRRHCLGDTRSRR